MVLRGGSTRAFASLIGIRGDCDGRERGRVGEGVEPLQAEEMAALIPSTNDKVEDPPRIS